jgi:transposase-like protein
MQEAIRILRHFVADILAEGNARLTIECIAIATNLSAYHGDSMTDVARRHGVTRQAVSKRCVDICDRLGLPPSRAMRSKEARAKYRESRFNRLNDIQKI